MPPRPPFCTGSYTGEFAVTLEKFRARDGQPSIRSWCVPQKPGEFNYSSYTAITEYCTYCGKDGKDRLNCMSAMCK